MDVVHPRQGEIAKTIDLPGDVVGFYEAALHAKVTGYLKTISVDKGDSVKKGQVLADDRSAGTAIEPGAVTGEPRNASG